MGSKNPIRVILGKTPHTENYTDSEGKDASKSFFTTGPNGAVSLKPGGSVFCGMLTLVLGIMTPLGEIVMVLEGCVARIRVDGEFVIEPTLRKDDFFPQGEVTAQRGGFVHNLIGDVSRVALGEIARKSIPALAKNVKTARAQLAKRAA